MFLDHPGCFSKLDDLKVRIIVRVVWEVKMSACRLVQVIFHVLEVLIHSIPERPFALSYILLLATCTRDEINDIVGFTVIGTFLFECFFSVVTCEF